MNNMRRSDRQMDNAEAMDLLVKAEYGILSTVSKENEPYGIPLSYVVYENKIYFHCANVGSKLDNLENNKKVCFSVVGKTKILPDKFSTEYESVIAFGSASIIFGEEKISALKRIVEKYSSNFVKEGNEYINRAHEKTTVVKIEIENLTGKHRV